MDILESLSFTLSTVAKTIEVCRGGDGNVIPAWRASRKFCLRILPTLQGIIEYSPGDEEFAHDEELNLLIQKITTPLSQSYSILAPHESSLQDACEATGPKEGFNQFEKTLNDLFIPTVSALKDQVQRYLQSINTLLLLWIIEGLAHEPLELILEVKLTELGVLSRRAKFLADQDLEKLTELYRNNILSLEAQQACLVSMRQHVEHHWGTVQMTINGVWGMATDTSDEDDLTPAERGLEISGRLKGHYKQAAIPRDFTPRFGPVKSEKTRMRQAHISDKYAGFGKKPTSSAYGGSLLHHRLPPPTNQEHGFKTSVPEQSRSEIREPGASLAAKAPPLLNRIPPQARRRPVGSSNNQYRRRDAPSHSDQPTRITGHRIAARSAVPSAGVEAIELAEMTSPSRTSPGLQQRAAAQSGRGHIQQVQRERGEHYQYSQLQEQTWGSPDDSPYDDSTWQQPSPYGSRQQQQQQQQYAETPQSTYHGEDKSGRYARQTPTHTSIENRSRSAHVAAGAAGGAILGVTDGTLAGSDADEAGTDRCCRDAGICSCVIM